MMRGGRSSEGMKLAGHERGRRPSTRKPDWPSASRFTRSGHHSPRPLTRPSRMVEAAGVEPASENTSSQITTCVSPFSCRNRLETEPSAPVAIPDMSHRHASGRNVAASLLSDDQSRAVGALKLIAHRLLSGESVVCVRSYVVFPRDLRGAWASARVPRSRTPVEAKSPPEVKHR